MATSGAPGPVTGAERIASLDVLRGFAVLGILAMNIQSFAMVGAAYFTPIAFGDLGGLNYWVWRLSDLLANMKFVTLFSMLFGAGVLLMAERAEAAGLRAGRLHYRRTAALLLFGLMHAYLLWSGDILVAYALCGSLVFLFRFMPARALLISGLVFLGIGSGLLLVSGLTAPHWSAEELTEFQDEQLPPPSTIAAELADYRSGLGGVFRRRASESFEMHAFAFPFYMFWRGMGCMLIGMALLRWGVLGGRRSAATYRLLLGAGLLIGLPLVNWGTRLKIAAQWEAIPSFFVYSAFNYWGSVVVALGWIGAIVLLTRSRFWRPLVDRLAACGRMAFSNYIGQTLLCTTLFYGYGLGLFGSVSRVGQAGIVLVIWALQLIVSPLWLARFRFGPLEWLWRSLTYGSRQRMRRV